MKKFITNHKIISTFLLLIFQAIISILVNKFVANKIDSTSLFYQFLKIDWRPLFKSVLPVELMIINYLSPLLVGSIIASIWYKNKFPRTQEIVKEVNKYIPRALIFGTVIIVFMFSSSEIVDYLTKIGGILFIILFVVKISKK